MRKFISLGISLLMLSACGDADEATKAQDAKLAANTEVAQQVAAIEPAAGAAAQAVGQEGTWGDLVYGDPNAPVEVIEYASFTCPHCATWAAAVFPRLKEKYIDTGKVKFIFRNYVRDRLDLAAATTARCSTPEVSKVLTKSLFANQSVWAQSPDQIGEMAAIARRAGVSRTQFDMCMANREMHEHLVKMTQDGLRQFDIKGTPTVVVNGKVVPLGWDTLDAAVAGAL